MWKRDADGDTVEKKNVSISMSDHIPSFQSVSNQQQSSRENEEKDLANTMQSLDLIYMNLQTNEEKGQNKTHTQFPKIGRANSLNPDFITIRRKRTTVTS